MRHFMKTITLAAASLALLATHATAADHLDSPSVTTDAATDINDLFAWMSPDGTKLNLIMTVFPAATDTSAFSDSAQYVFHLNSSAAYGEAATSFDILCRFDAAQQIQCWAGNEDYVAGDASAAGGLASMNGMFTVHAGLHDDPFFFNIDGFNTTVSTVISAAPGLTFDAAGCPALDAATSNALVSQLQTAPDGGAAMDFFAPLNTMAIAIEVDASLVTPGGAILGVWASTRTSL